MARSRKEGRKFKSKPRSSEENKKRRTGGGDWDSIIKSEFSIFKAREGKNTIRIISPNLWVGDPEVEVGWVGADYWSKHIYVHNQVGGTYTSYLCPQKMNGDPCPICEDRARAEVDSDGSEDDLEYIKKLRPSKRAIAYLIDKKEDDQEVLVWSMPLTQMEKAIALVSEDEYDNADIAIDCPEEGLDILFTFGKESGMYGYTGVKLGRPSVVESEFLEFVADNPLPDVLQVYSYARIKEVHEGAHTAAKTDNDDNDEETSSGDQNDNPLTYAKVLDMDEDDLYEILDEDSDYLDEELEDMDEEALRAAVCKVFKLEPEAEEDTPKGKAKRQRKRRKG